MISETLARNPSPSVCVCVAFAVCFPGMCPRRLFISVTSMKNMWHPTAWPLWWKVRVELTSSKTAGWEDTFWHGLKLQSTRTYCSRHHNRAVISLLYCMSYFSTLLFFNALNLSEIYSSVGRAYNSTKGFCCCHANLEIH